jgi:hypothetical protein
MISRSTSSKRRSINSFRAAAEAAMTSRLTVERDTPTVSAISGITLP